MAVWRCKVIADCQLPIENEVKWFSHKTIGNYQLAIGNEQSCAPPTLSNQRGENFRVGSGITGVARPDLRIVADGDPVLQRWCYFDGGIKSVAQKDKRCLPRCVIRKKHTAFEGIVPCQFLIKDLNQASTYTCLNQASSQNTENCNNSVTNGAGREGALVSRSAHF